MQQLQVHHQTVWELISQRMSDLNRVSADDRGSGLTLSKLVLKTVVLLW